MKYLQTFEYKNPITNKYFIYETRNDFFILELTKKINANNIRARVLYYSIDKVHRIIRSSIKDNVDNPFELTKEWLKGLRYQTDNLDDAIKQLESLISGTKFGL
jgi:hypothetical protein